MRPAVLHRMRLVALATALGLKISRARLCASVWGFGTEFAKQAMAKSVLFLAGNQQKLSDFEENMAAIAAELLAHFCAFWLIENIINFKF